MFWNLDEATIQITNLPEEIQEQGLRDLLTSFGPVSQVYLAKDTASNTSKGFAVITFNDKKDAQKAIECLSEMHYGLLMLKVESTKFVLSKLSFSIFISFFLVKHKINKWTSFNSFISYFIPFSGSTYFDRI